MTAYALKEGFTIGCDPELFLADANGKLVCADGLIPGTKAEPYKVPGGAVQVDGMAAEFNIDPVNTFEGFRDNINTVMATLKEMVPTGTQFVIKPAVVFDDDVWEAAPDHAKELGCMPDFNAWTGAMNPPPRDNSNPTMRTASGHVHIGWTNDVELSDDNHINNCRDLVRQLDFYLGGWSLWHDEDPTRRRLYGKAGACRYKPYGVEYRVLSNFWLLSEDKMKEVWNRICIAIDDMQRAYMPALAAIEENKRLIRAIETGKIDSKLYNKYSYPLFSA